MPLLPVIPGQLPSGFCATDYQSILNEFSAHQSVDVGASSGVSFVVSATKPTDTTVAWLQVDQFGRPAHLYWFAAGAWLSLHPLVSGLTQWWFDTVPDFTTFDGGDALAASVISGPMWQLAKRPNGTVIAAQFPIAVGTLPSATVLAVGDIGGEEKHALISAEGAPHFHGFGDGDTLGNDGHFIMRSWSTPAPVGTGMLGIDTTPPAAISPPQSSGALGTSDPLSSSGPAGDPHQNMPPYVVGYLLARTSRLFYAIT